MNEELKQVFIKILDQVPSLNFCTIVIRKYGALLFTDINHSPKIIRLWHHKQACGLMAELSSNELKAAQFLMVTNLKAKDIEQLDNAIDEILKLRPYLETCTFDYRKKITGENHG